VFDVSGRVVAGPAPRPLDPLPSKVDNGRLFIVFKEFKSGVAKQIEL
jgi:menaquinol-cytochrome c reductase iron-sulfur subunit